MNLLPKKYDDFRTKEYWNKFFTQRKDVFEWYGEYSDLCGILHKYCRVNERILMVGCGNSRISEDMYDVGYKGIANIDISEVVIKQMKEKNRVRRPEMEYTKMDMLQMDYEDEKFNVVFDKGALDAIFTGSSDEIIAGVEKMFAEVQRVLKVGGRYICCTLAQDHVLDKVLDYFSNGWLIRVHDVMPYEKSGMRTVFIFILTKTKSSGQPSPFNILELCIDGVDKARRVQTIEEMREAIMMKQRYDLMKNLIAMKFHPGENFSFDLWSDDPNIKEPRFNLTVVDSEESRKQNGKFAIFIVPQGRETEWFFSSDEGLAQLSSEAAFQRLVVVSLNRGHKYVSIDKIKEELSAKVMDLAPEGVTDNTKVPFLSVGGDVGIRETICEGCSESTGDYIVEDVTVGEDRLRRLVFLKNTSIIQSEAGLFTQKDGKKKEGHVDFSSLPCHHHRAMVAGLGFVKGILDNVEEKKHGLLVGLGGGGLAMFIHQFFTQIVMDVVELDDSLVDIAKTWFGCVEDKRLKIHIKDGLSFIEEAHQKDPRRAYHTIMLDVDSKDVTVGMSCPPQAFVDQQMLTRAKDLLHDQGVFILNLVARSNEVKAAVMTTIKAVFPRVYHLDIAEDVNDVIFALPNMDSNEETFDMTSLFASVEELQNCGKRKGTWHEEVNLCELIEGIKIA